MSAATPVMQNKSNVALRKAVVRRMIQVFGQVVVVGLILFLASGRLDWTWAWVYVGLSAGVPIVMLLWLLPRHADLVAERAEAKQGTKQWDRTLTTLLIPVGLLMYLVAGLDYRFGWTGDLPAAAHVAGALMMLLGYALVYWAMMANRFFATTVRIQSERGHTVITGGPYRFVRHPGYVGIILSTVAALILLGSLWALIPGGINAALYVVRTALEDRTLQAELPGYRDFAGRTRYRLLPGVW